MADLKYVYYRVRPCFPPEFDVMQIYVHCYEQHVIDRIKNSMDVMRQIVETQPQAVLAFNKFVHDCKDVQKELRIQLQNFAEVEFHLREFQAIYMDYLNEYIGQQFRNIAEMQDGYFEQEDRIIDRVIKREQVEYRTTLVYTVYEVMTNQVKAIEG